MFSCSFWGKVFLKWRAMYCSIASVFSLTFITISTSLGRFENCGVCRIVNKVSITLKSWHFHCAESGNGLIDQKKRRQKQSSMKDSLTEVRNSRFGDELSQVRAQIEGNCSDRPIHVDQKTSRRLVAKYKLLNSLLKLQQKQLRKIQSQRLMREFSLRPLRKV